MVICHMDHPIKSGDDGGGNNDVIVSHLGLSLPKQTPCIPLKPRYTARLIRV